MSSLSPATPPLHAHVGRAFVGTEKGEETILLNMTASFLLLPFSDKVLWIKEIHVVEVSCLPLTYQKTN